LGHPDSAAASSHKGGRRSFSWYILMMIPINQSFHDHDNAGTFMRVGEAMGKAMVELKKT
jgi:hypothetical protein